MVSTSQRGFGCSVFALVWYCVFRGNVCVRRVCCSGYCCFRCTLLNLIAPAMFLSGRGHAALVPTVVAHFWLWIAVPRRSQSCAHCVGRVLCFRVWHSFLLVKLFSVTQMWKRRRLFLVVVPSGSRVEPAVFSASCFWDHAEVNCWLCV